MYTQVGPKNCASEDDVRRRASVLKLASRSAPAAYQRSQEALIDSVIKTAMLCRQVLDPSVRGVGRAPHPPLERGSPRTPHRGILRP
ncbi:hypothetical protein GCM10027063_13680 [Promicromonospora xylanilytica]